MKGGLILRDVLPAFSIKNSRLRCCIMEGEPRKNWPTFSVWMLLSQMKYRFQVIVHILLVQPNTFAPEITV
jgi:hypothetical protein